MKGLYKYLEQLKLIAPKNMEVIWVSLNSYDITKRTEPIGLIYSRMSDSELILYKIWSRQNEHWLRDKHIYHKNEYNSIPDTTEINKISFHGGCHGCIAQEIFGIDRCLDCKYFRGTSLRSNLDLSIKEPNS